MIYFGRQVRDLWSVWVLLADQVSCEEQLIHQRRSRLGSRVAHVWSHMRRFEALSGGEYLLGHSIGIIYLASC